MKLPHMGGGHGGRDQAEPIRTHLQVTIETPECILEPLEPDLTDSGHLAEFGYVTVRSLVLDAFEEGRAEPGQLGHECRWDEIDLAP